MRNRLVKQIVKKRNSQVYNAMPDVSSGKALDLEISLQLVQISLVHWYLVLRDLRISAV